MNQPLVVDFPPFAYESYRTNRARSLYNVDADKSGFKLDASWPGWGGEWKIGAVYGPSGSGKTSLGKQMGGRFVEAGDPGFDQEVPLIDALKGGDYNSAATALAAVGLGTVPSWLRPYPVLSNGEKFRAEMAALLLAGNEQRVVLDEFTSVLDRQVAKIAALAFGKAWRRQDNGQVVVVTPHRDVLDWLAPDWVLETAEAGSGGAAVLHGSEWVQSPPEDHGRDRERWVATLEV